VETDDDNFPSADFWRSPSREIRGRLIEKKGWVNAYRYFSDTFIYPRGFPPHLAREGWDGDFAVFSPEDTAFCPVQQCLADGNPDVDAIYRMLFPLPLHFRRESPLILDRGSWCPSNSQNTVFFPEIFPLLYLPATCSFRMTDIWRSLVAQRILWTCGWNLSFHSATVVQVRNPHDLQADFEQEISGYLGNTKIVEVLIGLDLKSGRENIQPNLELCYQTLIRAGILAAMEETLLTTWFQDFPGTKKIAESSTQ